MKTIIIAIANQKGGVGKTTTAVTQAHGFAQRGYRVLLVDLDLQGHDAVSLGLDPGDDLYHWLHPDPGLHRPLEQAITPSGRPNLDVIRSHKKTEPLLQTLAGLDHRHLVLADALAEAGAYDLVLLDCAPAAGLLQTAAMVAADHLLVPTQLNQLSVQGIQSIRDSLKSVHRISRSNCQIAGIIPVQYNRTMTESTEQLKHLATTFGKLVLPPIPQDTKCIEAVRARQTLWEYAPRCRALLGFVNGGGKFVGGYIQVMERLEERL